MASDPSPVPQNESSEPTSSSTEKEGTYFDIRHSSTPETLITDDNLIVYTSALSPPIQDGLGPRNELAEFVPMPTPNVLTPDKEVIEPYATIEEKSSRPQPPPAPSPIPTIPALPLNLNNHKIGIACNWIPIIFSGGLLPIIFYFSLHYTTNLEVRYILTIPLVLTAITTSFSLGSRIYALAKPGSKCRPLNTSHANDIWDWTTLDFFTYNYFFGFIVVTILISVGIGLEDLKIVSLPLSILILYICAEMIIAEIAMLVRLKAPFRISSIPRGGELRPAVYVIVEDVVAVEGGMGRAWREVWARRYEVDEEFKKFLKVMDWVWGVSGLLLVAAIFGIVFGVSNSEIGFVVGWVAPWVWAGGMTGLTVWSAKRMLVRSRRRYGNAVGGNDGRPGLEVVLDG